MNTSENDIKKAALAFLKSHYRYRPRSSDVQWQLDRTTPDGIIADGVFSYKDDDGKAFLATFEATSYLTRDEVKYRFLYRAMIWDGLAVGSLLVALVVSYGFGTQRFDVLNWGIGGGLVRLVGSVLVITSIYVFLNRFRHRYRYIYAIEQFKRYHADEQWVAIGSDVFPDTDDKFLRELREQCIIGGFGLVSIQPDLDAQLLITPARVSLFGETRQAIDFVTESKWAKRIRSSKIASGYRKIRGLTPKVRQKLPEVGAKIQDGYSKIAPKIKERLPVVKALDNRGVLLNRREFVQGLQRYRRSHWRQVVLTTISLAVIGGLFFNELRKADLIVLDNKKYLNKKDLNGMTINNIPEPDEYVVDTPYVAPYGEGGLTYRDENERADPMLNNDRFDTEDINVTPPTKSATRIADVESPVVMRARPTLIRDSLMANGVGIYAPDLPNLLMTYDCARFFNFEGAQYFVQEGIYPSQEIAIERIRFLVKSNVPANYLWLGCFNENSNQYALFFDYLTDDLIEAQATARKYEELMKKRLGEEKEITVQQIQQ